MNLNHANLFELDLNISKVHLVPPLLDSPPSHQQDRSKLILLLRHASDRLIFLLKIPPPSATKKDRRKQGAQNLPPETPGTDIASANGSTASGGGGDYREREGRGGKPPDSSVISDSLQAVNTDVKIEREDLTNLLDDDWDGEYEVCADELLGNPVDPGPGEG